MSVNKNPLEGSKTKFTNVNWEGAQNTDNIYNDTGTKLPGADELKPQPQEQKSFVDKILDFFGMKNENIQKNVAPTVIEEKPETAAEVSSSNGLHTLEQDKKQNVHKYSNKNLENAEAEQKEVNKHNDLGI